MSMHPDCVARRLSFQLGSIKSDSSLHKRGEVDPDPAIVRLKHETLTPYTDVLGVFKIDVVRKCRTRRFTDTLLAEIARMFRCDDTDRRIQYSQAMETR
jgi:hypothetical protein